MLTQSLVDICADYGITAHELRVASTVEATIAGKINKDDNKGTIQPVIEEFHSLLGDQGMINAIRWATWMKQSREVNKQALEYPELLKLRQTDEKGA